MYLRYVPPIINPPIKNPPIINPPIINPPICTSDMYLSSNAHRAHRDSVVSRFWPEPYVYDVYTALLAGKSPNIRSKTIYM